MEQVAEQMNLPMLWQDDVYDLPGWLKMVHDLGIADNQGYARCGYCYESRLALTCAIASENGSTALPQACCIPAPAARRYPGIGTRVAASGDYKSDAGFGSVPVLGLPPLVAGRSTVPRKWACTARTTVPVFSASTSGLRRS